MKAFCGLLLVALCVSQTVAVEYVKYEADARLQVPRGWTLVQADAHNEEVSFVISLTNQHAEDMHDEVMKVSDPKSEKYGQYWTKEEVADHFGASAQAVAVVSKWLKSHGILNFAVKGHRDFISGVTKAANLEKMLQVKMHLFRHDQTQKTVVRSLQHYSVPSEIAPHVAVIDIKVTYKSASPRPIAGGTTPAKILAWYNITVPPTNNKNLQAVVSFLGQYYDPADLAAFQKFFKLPPNKIAKTLGPNQPSKPGTEASLDVDYLTGISQTIPTWVWSTGGEMPHQNEPWLVFLMNVSDASQAPYLYSMSYQDLEYTVTVDYASSCNLKFAALNLRGMTFVTGSGDWGVGCQDEQHCNAFTADFPSSSPYVTSLGATTFPGGVGPEKAVGFSSGGFSYYFAQPTFQKTAIAKYFAQPNKPAGRWYNATGRGFPDLATVGTDFIIYVGGGQEPVDGTSASTPTFASMLSMINSLRLAANKPVIGNPNALLYQAWQTNSAAFKDITAGETQQKGCCGTSFTPVGGWDPYTGLGVPNYGIIAAMAMDSNFIPALKEF